MLVIVQIVFDERVYQVLDKNALQKSSSVYCKLVFGIRMILYMRGFSHAEVKINLICTSKSTNWVKVNTIYHSYNNK